ncbi:hypothetical protein QBC36DRAFT_369901 [Triangularia setosa]|uniref:Uncharacterized protein n=1 Tax=Triangularia setosa TaxID=2587417 RepID=A0AAN7A1P4_9PEZI|nr:hypothetical protein QBC36DRAFT_369901 [Podospora setosa]
MSDSKSENQPDNSLRDIENQSDNEPDNGPCDGPDDGPSDDQDGDQVLTPNLNLSSEDFAPFEVWARRVAGLDHDEINVFWDAHMALILFWLRSLRVEPSNTKEAENRARKAVEKDTTTSKWKTSFLLAQIAESEAIEILSPVAQKLYDDNLLWQNNVRRKEMLANMLIQLGEKYLETGESPNVIKSAVESYNKSLGVYRGNHEAHRWAIERLAEKCFWNEVILLVEAVPKAQVLPAQHEGLSTKQFLAPWVYVFDRFAKQMLLVARQLHRWDLLQDVFELGLAGVPSNFPYGRFLSQRNYAWCLLHHPSTRDKGIGILEKITKETPTDRRFSNAIFTELTATLVPIYTRREVMKKKSRANSAPNAGLTPTNRAEQRVLWLYWQYTNASKGSDSAFKKAATQLYFACYIFIRGEAQKAKGYAKELIQLCLQWMTDTDPTNDYTAFWNLALVFSTFHDEENLWAAWDMMAVARKVEFDADVADWEERKIFQRIPDHHLSSQGMLPTATVASLHGHMPVARGPVWMTVGRFSSMRIAGRSSRMEL